MSKRLPKAARSTMNEIQGTAGDAPPQDGGVRIVPAPSDPAPDLSKTPLRRAQASLIVGRYRTYSALGSCIPLAVVDALSVTAIIVSMVRELAKHYDVPFAQDQAQACIAALTAGIVSPVAGNVATRLLNTVFPVGWMVSAAVGSATAAAFTSYIGKAFIEHFESGGKLVDFDAARVRSRLRWS